MLDGNGEGVQDRVLQRCGAKYRMVRGEDGRFSLLPVEGQHLDLQTRIAEGLLRVMDAAAVQQSSAGS